MRLPFEQLTIHALRGIRNLELSNLGQVNLLVGENDSGKTTVLEALALCCNPLDPVTWVQTVLRRAGSLQHTQFDLDQFRWFFPQRASIEPGSPPESVHLRAHGAVLVEFLETHLTEVSGVLTAMAANTTRNEIRGVELDLEVWFQLQREAALTQQTRTFTVWEQMWEPISSQEGPHVPCQFIAPHDHRLASAAIQGFSAARLSGIQESIKALLNSLDPRIVGMEILAPHGQPMLYLQDAAAGLAPLSAFGDGIRRVLLLALALPQAADGVLLIDELETAIHVSALGKVFRWLMEACKQYRVQLFATTHSLEALDAILGADTTAEEDIVGYRLGRMGERVEVKRYGEDLLKRLRYERGLDVR
jgi:energy-coupling factor transporter ATP-binding protein EcfA2